MLRIIDLCESVRQRGLDPFDVRVREFFDRLREILPRLKRHEDLYLDIQAVLGLAEVIFQQGEWVKHKSSLLYLDPLLVMLKLHALPPRDLAEIFIRSWHPVVELEAISPHGIREAKDYWIGLPSLEERYPGLDAGEMLTKQIARGELERMGIVSAEEFSKALERMSGELQKAAGEKGEVSYWEFIMAPSFEKTVERAWFVSFLITSGYATAEVRPLEEEILLKPVEGPRGSGKAVPSSLAIPISREEWERRRAFGKS
jgi:hypothetical protein